MIFLIIWLAAAFIGIPLDIYWFTLAFKPIGRHARHTDWIIDA